MCGLVGYSGNFQKDDLISGVAKLNHRGPDDNGIFIDKKNGVGLGHTRLSIQDLSALGHQPMLSEDGNIALVFNGEIYNFKELKKDLINKGYKFKSGSDTEVILNLYIDMGLEMLDKLNGIFAFAFYDLRTGEIFIARDRLGIKPLYYSNLEDGFIFASEIKALIDFLPDKKKVDLSSLNKYLSFLWCPGEGTPLENVKKLLPGEALLIHNGKIKEQWTWFKLPIFRNVKASLSKNEAINKTKLLLNQAVNRQLISDVPVGAFLSGGLDSSSIVAMAKQQNPNIECFTIETIGGVEEGMTDDLPYAKQVAKHLDVDLNVISISSNMMCDNIVSMVEQLDEPLSDPAALNLKYISQLAKNQGIKVLLSGAGGDDLFTGYRRHKAITLDKYWHWLPKNILRQFENTANKFDQRKPFLRRVSKFFDGASLTEDERLSNFFIWSKDDQLIKLFNHDRLSEFIKCSPTEPMIDFLSPLINKSIHPLDKMLALEQRFFLTDHNLNYTDKMSMSEGVEVRVPFLDNDLLEFAQQIPLKYKFRNGEGKWILKKSMEEYLPLEVIYRPKTGFGAPLRHWIRNELKDLVGDILSYDSIQKRGLFNPSQVHEMISNNQSGKVDAAYTIFSILCIEIWCRSFID